MAKTKRAKRVHRQHVETVLPTREWLAKGHIVSVDATIERHGERSAQTMRRVNRAGVWCRYGWINPDHQRAFDAWEVMQDRCRWDIAAIDYSANRSGSGQGCRPEAIGDARARYRALDSALRNEFGHLAVLTVYRWLAADDAPDYAEHFGSGRDDGRRRAESLIRQVGEALHRLIR